MMTVELRRSRKLRRCDCGTIIAPGDQYLLHIAFPGDNDLGNETFQRSPECRPCAVEFGRWPIPNGGIDQR
jgi:hypothetical protein